MSKKSGVPPGRGGVNGFLLTYKDVSFRCSQKTKMIQGYGLNVQSGDHADGTGIICNFQEGRMFEKTKEFELLNEALKAFIEKGQELYLQIEKVIRIDLEPEPEPELKTRPVSKPAPKPRSKPVRKPAPKVEPKPEPAKKVTTKLRKNAEKEPVAEQEQPPAKKAAVTVTPRNVSEIVMEAVRRMSGEFSANEIQAQTGLQIKQVWDSLNRAKKKGLINNPEKGVYVAV